MRKVKVAVTGAAGQVGSVLVRRLHQLPGIETIAVCRNEFGAAIIQSAAPGCQIRVGSIDEPRSAAKILKDSDAIINCALSMVAGKPKLSRNMNIKMIDNYAQLEKLKTFVHMSSVSVYGGCIDRYKNARSTFDNPQPDNDYGRSKLYVERYASSIFLKNKIKLFNLRIGHVIGANMDRSKEILQLASDPEFKLPFDGRGPSNTIHVDELATRVIAIITTEEIMPGTYNVANKAESWRKVFDWHTDATDLPPVQGMGIERSKEMKKYYRSRSIIKDLIKWISTLSVLRLLEYPAIYEFAYRFVAIAPEILTSYLATQYKKIYVAKQVKTINKHGENQIAPVYFSDHMPGPYLELPSHYKILDAPCNEQSKKSIRQWYFRYSQVRWLPNSLSSMK